MEEASVQQQPEYIRVGTVKRWVSSRRNQRITLTCTPETRVRIKEAAAKLFMNQAEFIEWLMTKYASGHVMVFEEGAFMEGLVRTLDDRAERVAKEVAQREVQAAFYEKGIASSPFLK